MVVPPEIEVELIVSGVGAAATVRAMVAVADWTVVLESLAVTPKEKLPLVVGLPEITPVEAARVRPAGSDPVVTVHL